MTSTRQRLLDYLLSQRSATAREIGRALQITPADARYHLEVLTREGLVVAVPAGGVARFHARPGRPARRYGLASFGWRDNFDLLCGALLAEALADLPASGREAFLRRVAARLAAARRNEWHRNASLTARLVAAIQRLNELGYPGRWEARPGAPRLILERRPFATLLEQHPEADPLDIYLIEALLGVQITRGKEEGVYVVGKAEG